MCWKSYNIPKKRIAEEDISVFKILYQGYRSIYYKKSYDLNKLYVTELDTPINCPDCYGRNHFIVNKGFHSYFNKSIVTKCNSKSNPFTSIYIIGEMGVFLDRLSSFDSYLKVWGVIPKGAEYYLNEFGETVSDKIILKKCEEVI